MNIYLFQIKVKIGNTELKSVIANHIGWLDNQSPWSLQASFCIPDASKYNTGNLSQHCSS